MTEKKRIAIYVKLPVTEDAGTSFIAQQKACRAWAEDNGYVVEKVYSELPEPEAHVRLLDLIRSKKHGVLVAAERNIYGESDEDQREVNDAASRSGVLLYEAKTGIEWTSFTLAGEMISRDLRDKETARLRFIAEKMGIKQAWLDLSFPEYAYLHELLSGQAEQGSPDATSILQKLRDAVYQPDVFEE
ncbi:recombinase family protein [Streptomyces sp. UNOC14_S4]|uniref:recombinase family protein n=1 Tax=Streptomyces sp. UNOC14_S4 TaxID=2872340 RepID=UPI001E3C21A1|nr:recombinase family protein [Streptomyces sp. UNOC14_S4]MCC3766492.1 recombinase family protein [Streptomyces sp. UNOC14_S4]